MKKITQVFVIAIMAFFIAACSDSNNTPEKTAEGFYNAMLEGNTDKVLELMDLPAEMKDPKMKDQLKPKLDMLVKKVKSEVDKTGGIDSIKASNVTYNDDKTKASVTVIVKGKDGSEEKAPINLINVDGKWLVNPK